MTCRRNSRPKSCATPIFLPRMFRRLTLRAARICVTCRLVTIDGEDAKDFDDAVYAEATPAAAGGWSSPSPMSATTCATAARWISKPGRAPRPCTFRIASFRCCRNIYPIILCSLMPRVERLAFVCDMHVSKTGKPGKARFYEAVIRLACTAHLRSGVELLAESSSARCRAM